MRIKHLVLFAGAAVLSFSAAAAPQGAETERVEVRPSQMGQKHLGSKLFKGVQGDYALEDGRVLTVSGTDQNMRRVLTADLGDGPTEIVHVGRGQFVAVDRDVRFRFDGDRMAEQVVITTMQGKQLALAKR